MREYKFFTNLEKFADYKAYETESKEESIKDEQPSQSQKSEPALEKVEDYGEDYGVPAGDEDFDQKFSELQISQGPSQNAKILQSEKETSKSKKEENNGVGTPKFAPKKYVLDLPAVRLQKNNLMS